MMKRLSSFAIAISVIFCQLAIGQGIPTDTLLLFFLGGQSNMEGFGYNSDLPASLDREFKDVWIFHGNAVPDEVPGGGLGIWAPLNPGHGFCFTSDGKTNTLCDRFGVELTFAARLQELYPGKKIALIKYARGGSSVDSLAAGDFGCWEPDYRGKTGINQYDHFLTTVRNAMSVTDINNDGTEDYLFPCGIIWMQGESDAYDLKEAARRYYANLKRLMDLQRAAFRVDDLPVVLGMISDSGNDEDGRIWKYGSIVQAAEERFAVEDGHAALVRSTLEYGYSDPYHYNSQGYIDLGEKFADAVFLLLINSLQTFP
jgi:hypothetical protein